MARESLMQRENEIVREGEIAQRHWGALVKGGTKVRRCNESSHPKEILSELLDVLAEDEYLDISEGIAEIQNTEHSRKDENFVGWTRNVILQLLGRRK